MEDQNFEGLRSKVKEESPVEFVLILPRPTIGWPAIKKEKDVKPKLWVKSVKLTKFDGKWRRSNPELFHTFHTCPHCQLVAKRIGHLTRHIRTCSEVNPARLECDFCGKRFLKKKSIQSHMLKHSSEKKFCCTKCGAGFKTKESLVRHSRANKIYECAACDVKFACYLLLDRHRREFHGDHVFKCDQCSYQTKRKDSLMVHKGKHDKSFTCETCQKKFSMNKLLKVHQMQHRHGIYATAPEETFDCDKCDKSFSTPNYLRKHQSSVHDEKEVKCDVCGRICKNQDSLRQHSQNHNKVECSVCHKMISKYQMPSHLHSHSVGNDFKCDLCDLSSKSKKNLKKHIERIHLLRKLVNDFKRREDFSEFELLEKLQLNHGSLATTNERKFKCDKCTKAFVTPYALSEHKKGVHVEKLFGCAICKKTFKTKSDLNRHKSRVHAKK